MKTCVPFDISGEMQLAELDNSPAEQPHVLRRLTLVSHLVKKHPLIVFSYSSSTHEAVSNGTSQVRIQIHIVGTVHENCQNK